MPMSKWTSRRYVRRWERITVFGMKTKVTRAIVEIRGVRPGTSKGQYVLDVWRTSRRDERLLSGGGPGRYASKYTWQVRTRLALLAGVAGMVVAEGKASSLEAAKRYAYKEATTVFLGGY